jgi:phage major head subunit gpT-like protein
LSFFKTELVQRPSYHDWILDRPLQVKKWGISSGMTIPPATLANTAKFRRFDAEALRLGIAPFSVTALARAMRYTKRVLSANNSYLF